MGELGGKKFQGDFTAQARIFGFVYNAHAALSDLPSQEIIRNPSGRRLHFRRSITAENPVMHPSENRAD